jgi:hypothetical protein
MGLSSLSIWGSSPFRGFCVRVYIWWWSGWGGFLAALSPVCDFCLSLHSPLGATHGVSDHDPLKDFTSPVIPRPPSPSPSWQPGTESSWACCFAFL